jgi:Tfp pilus assembly protein PilX
MTRVLCARRSRVVRAADEDGVALVIALMAVLLLSALGFALVMTTSTESMIAANYSNAQEGLYAADAVVERAMDDLLTVPDWNKLLDGSTTSAFVDGAPSGTRTMTDGSTLDLTQVLNNANCGKATTCSASDLTSNATGARPWGANNPVWQLYAYGPVNNLLPTGTINSPFYAVVMVADDPSENDNNPALDGIDSATNPGSGVLAMRAEAWGPRGAHKVIELTVARTSTTELERGYTGQRGQDEQNRRARKSPVQSPGKALTNQSLTLATGGIS